VKLTVSVFLVEASPKRFKWSATRPDGSEYKGSSESFGASAKARDAADQAFNNAISWDWEYERHAPERLGTPVCRGHVFVSEDV